MSMVMELSWIVLDRLSISMYCKCPFNKLADIGEASQSGYVDLSELLSHGLVPSDLNVAEADFNSIEDPQAVYGRPGDQFEAMTMAKTLNARAKAAEAAAAAREEQ